ncbi:MAG TPA: hypothetical protein VM533_21545 [Fimbriiglobus sp.]|jgi:hypothetical protein|nr:hypothetical protein [Fimbriiglobus sp.]
MTRLRYVAPALLAVAALRADPPPAALTDAEAAAVLKTVRPAAGEDLYAQVPWLTSLWEARKTAAAAGKPILLWEMDGHPLGCG